MRKLRLALFLVVILVHSVDQGLLPLDKFHSHLPNAFDTVEFDVEKLKGLFKLRLGNFNGGFYIFASEEAVDVC